MNENNGFFRSFQQEPSQKTIDRIWQKAGARQTELARTTQKIPPIQSKLAWAVLVIIVLVIGVLTVPPLRSFAQGIIDLFTRTEDDTFQYTIERSEYSGRPIIDVDEIGAYYFETIEGAEAKAGFEIYAPTKVPEGYSFIGVGYVAPMKKVEQEYRFSDSLSFRLVQQPVENFLADPFRSMMIIGPDSLIEHVHIGTVEGQFVQGSWTILAEDFPPSRETNEITLHWDQNAPIRVLRWEMDGFVFTIRAFFGWEDSSPNALSMEQMISIAETVRP